jgi:2-iminoacetate synthase ThiH
VDVEAIAELLRARDPLAAARAAGVRPSGEVVVERGPAPAGLLVDGDEEGAIEAHEAAHARGRPSEAALAYGAGRDPREVAERLAALAALAARTGLLRAVCPVPAEGTADRPGSWGVEDLTVVAACRLALPDDVAVRPHWRRLGPAACQVAVAFGATGWRIPEDDPTDAGALAAAVGRRVAT